MTNWDEFFFLFMRLISLYTLKFNKFYVKHDAIALLGVAAQ